MAKQKAVIGCEGFKITVQDGNGFDKGKIFDIPGLQEVGLELESEQGKIHADNETALILNSGVTGATVTGNFVELSSEERSELLGVSIENGMEVYKKDLVPPYVSASWKYRCNDGSYIYMGATRGNFGLPSSSASTLEDGAPEHQDQVELEGTFIPREDGVVFVRVHDKSENFDESKFMELIHGEEASNEEEPETP
ncbi:hypothetical protein KYJ98_09275 [Mammaliicoccus lentus]|uniref:major tail protein n=1 Tax=Mammaliicoccus lentus TaxID=42858 RepID=UPI001C4DDACE|nr:major tail protein [Mammaliicoccus lentus]MBW0770507.1 hypothetical protein [Mammaliicoccus lentus]